jgi:hypothetical protein
MQYEVCKIIINTYFLPLIKHIRFALFTILLSLTSFQATAGVGDPLVQLNYCLKSFEFQAEGVSALLVGDLEQAKQSLIKQRAALYMCRAGNFPLITYYTIALLYISNIDNSAAKVTTASLSLQGDFKIFAEVDPLQLYVTLPNPTITAQGCSATWTGELKYPAQLLNDEGDFSITATNWTVAGRLSLGNITGSWSFVADSSNNCKGNWNGEFTAIESIGSTYYQDTKRFYGLVTVDNVTYQVGMTSYIDEQGAFKLTLDESIVVPWITDEEIVNRGMIIGSYNEQTGEAVFDKITYSEIINSIGPVYYRVVLQLEETSESWKFSLKSLTPIN